MAATALRASPHLVPISRPAVADEIVNRLIRLILEEQLRPGDRLPSEHELMAQLGVGRSSLREAVKTLRAIGVVDVVNGNGMFVGRGGASLGSRPLSWGLLMRESGARELIDARRLVESELAALAAERATEDEIQEIGRLATAQPESAGGDAYGRAAIDFHLAVARAAHNTVLSYFLEGLQHILRDWISDTYEAYPAETRVPDEHVPLYQAIRARDAAAARQAMANHLDAAGKRLLRLLDESERSGNGHARKTRLTWEWRRPDAP